MDIFLYQVAVAQLHSTKYVGELEALVRKWHEELKNRSWYSNTTDYTKLKLTYKLFTLSLNLFTARSKKTLPDFIYALQIQYQREILGKLLNPKNTFNVAPLLQYTEFLDFFEFDKVVETPNSDTCFITVLHNIFFDKPIHFKFKFNQKLNFFDKYTYTTVNALDESHKKFLYALRLKQTLSPDTPATVLDAYLAHTLADITKHVDISQQILLMQQHTAAMQTYQSTYGVLANEQS